jgi:hypothetical protein
MVGCCRGGGGGCVYGWTKHNAVVVLGLCVLASHGFSTKMTPVERQTSFFFSTKFRDAPNGTRDEKAKDLFGE